METTNPHPCTLQAIDDASAALILQLQREDAEALLQSSKGKNREDEVSDIDLAIGFLQQDLQATTTFLMDRCMSRSLARAVVTDSACLTDEIAREDSLANDRLVAERIQRGGEVECARGTLGDPGLDDLCIARLTALYVSSPSGECISAVDDDEKDPATSESSRSAAVRSEASNTTRYECVACGQHHRAFETFRTSCGHDYCQACLSELFNLSTMDETLFPPRCCRQPISLTAARLYLSSDLVRRFQQKAIEFQSSDRTYCSQPTCSMFITAADIDGERATCTACLQQTCTICKGNSHDGDCPQDTATQQVLAAAAAEGWQRCYNCRRLVELDIGCNHMTYVFCARMGPCATSTDEVGSCTCKAQFCYVCGERWKTCPCDQWDEDRLEARAEQIVAREQQPQRPMPPAQQAVQVEQAIENLRNRHNCTHDSWRWVRGPNQCEECYHNLPQYIFECRQCQIRACNRCRRNRL